MDPNVKIVIDPKNGERFYQVRSFYKCDSMPMNLQMPADFPRFACFGDGFAVFEKHDELMEYVNKGLNEVLQYETAKNERLNELEPQLGGANGYAKAEYRDLTSHLRFAYAIEDIWRHLQATAWYLPADPMLADDPYPLYVEPRVFLNATNEERARLLGLTPEAYDNMKTEIGDRQQREYIKNLAEAQAKRAAATAMTGGSRRRPRRSPQRRSRRSLRTSSKRRSAPAQGRKRQRRSRLR